jgi:hypothetical protein
VTSGFCWHLLTSILAGNVQTFEAGDMLIMLGDVNHAGVAWTNDDPNVRLFCYLPSASALPTWDSVGEAGEVLFPSLNEVQDDESNEDSLRSLTSPTHTKFSQESFDKHLFCSKTGKFFTFDSVAYYIGLQTIASRPSVYSRKTHAGVFSENPGCCKHWPNQASLFRAGMVDNTFRDLRRSADCPLKDDINAECVQDLPVKRVKSEKSSDPVRSPDSMMSIMASGPEMLSVQLQAAQEQIRLLNSLVAAKDEIISQKSEFISHLQKQLEKLARD